MSFGEWYLFSFSTTSCLSVPLCNPSPSLSGPALTPLNPPCDAVSASPCSTQDTSAPAVYITAKQSSLSCPGNAQHFVASPTAPAQSLCLQGQSLTPWDLSCSQVSVQPLADHIQVIFFRYITLYLAIQKLLCLFAGGRFRLYDGTFLLMIMSCQSVLPSWQTP